jgi:hypothetical protein
MSYIQTDPSDLEKITQNSVFDNCVAQMDYNNTIQAYTILYDVLYNSEHELFEIISKTLVQRLNEVPNLISKIILISFILNTEFFFRMFPDGSSDSSGLINFIHYYVINGQSIIQSIINNEDLTQHFIQFINNNNNIAINIINIHLENLYNFPFEWVQVSNQIMIPQNFVDISIIEAFNQNIYQLITQIVNPQPVAAGPNFNAVSPIQYNNQQPIYASNTGGKKNHSKKQRNKKHKSKNKKTRNKKLKKHTLKNKKKH